MRQHKNVFIILILVGFLFLISGCKKKINIEIAYNQTSFTDDAINIKYVITNKTLAKKDIITKAFIEYSFSHDDRTYKQEEVNIDGDLINADIKIQEQNYLDTIRFRLVLIVNDNFSFKSDYNDERLYDLALNFPSSSLANEIINCDIRLSKISLVVDYEKNEITKTEVGYTALISTNGIITIEIGKNTTLIDNFKIYINDVEIFDFEYDSNNRSIVVYNVYALNKIELSIQSNPSRVVIDDDISFDLVKNVRTKENEKYSIEYTNKNYDTITLKITLKEGYYFDSSFILYMNNKEVDGKKYSIITNVLTYEFDDPNWSEIY